MNLTKEQIDYLDSIQNMGYEKMTSMLAAQFCITTSKAKPLIREYNTEVRHLHGRAKEITEEDKQILKQYLDEYGSEGVQKFSREYLIDRDLCRKAAQELRAAGYKYPTHNNLNISLDTILEYIQTYGYYEGTRKLSEEHNLNLKAVRRKVNILAETDDKWRVESTIPLLEGEEFRQYFNSYYISNKGRVIHKTTHGEHLMKPGECTGYYRVQMSDNGKVIERSVHRMVAEVFIPNPDNLPFVDHIDTDRHNNCVENLRWVTQEENMQNELTRLHISIATGGSGTAFKIYVKDEYTGEQKEFNSMAQLYKYLGLDYIAKYTGVQTYRDRFTIVMCGENNDNYYIGRMLRRGTTKAELIEEVTNYSETREYHEYLKNNR